MGVENGTFEEEMSILSGNEEEPPSLPIQNGSTARRRNNLRFQGETASSDAPSYVLKGRMKDLYENVSSFFLFLKRKGLAHYNAILNIALS